MKRKVGTMKKSIENKKIEPESNKMVKVRILPLRGIGGIGGPGAEGVLPKEAAERYVAEGYCVIVEDEPPTVVGSSAQEE